MVTSAHDYKPFDTLPSELVAEIFKRALEPNSTGLLPSRELLSRVCQRWMGILKSHVCIGVPEEHHCTVTKYELESGYVFFGTVLQQF